MDTTAAPIVHRLDTVAAPMIFNDRWLLGDVVAAQWCPELEAQFPDADHNGCLQSMRWAPELGRWLALDPPVCHGYHCPRCGQPCGITGHSDCRKEQP